VGFGDAGNGPLDLSICRLPKADQKDRDLPKSCRYATSWISAHNLFPRDHKIFMVMQHLLGLCRSGEDA
jgi:hypothetical protein